MSTQDIIGLVVDTLGIAVALYTSSAFKLIPVSSLKKVPSPTVNVPFQIVGLLIAAAGIYFAVAIVGGYWPLSRESDLELDLKIEDLVSTEQGITLQNYTVKGPNDPPREGDTIVFQYTLFNNGDTPINLTTIFLAVRKDGQGKDPQGRLYDTEYRGQTTIEPSQNLPVTVQKTVTLGIWEFWPCYQLENDDYCEIPGSHIEQSVR